MPEVSQDQLEELIQKAYKMGWDAALDHIRPTAEKLVSQWEDIKKANDKARDALKSAQEVLRKPWYTW